MNISNNLKKLLSLAIFGPDLLSNLAQSIDRVLDRKKAACEDTACEDAACEDVICEKSPCDETACDEVCTESCEAPCEEECAEFCHAACSEVPVMAESAAVELQANATPLCVPEASDDVAEEATDEDEAEEMEEIKAGRFGSTTGLVFFDANANPERYAELLAREKCGDIRIVTRYRHSFASRICNADAEMREYYSALKNKLLSYKGVKARSSWGCESFNSGRNAVARINVKSKSLYLYLALDPAEVAALDDGKYRVNDLSAKKKYAGVPTLFKIRGPRKFKYALELIDLLCAQRMALSHAKKFKEMDYRSGDRTLIDLVKNGDVKMMVCGVPNDNE